VRTLDRYLAREVLVPTLYCFDAFAMLWIVIDLFDNLPDFIEFKAGLGTIFWYYFVTLPTLIVNILPISLLLGVLWCLANMSRANEITAIRASGLSVTRTAMPALLIGVAASLLVFAVNELFVPRSKERGETIIETLKGHPAKGAIRNFFYPTPKRYWFAASFDPVTMEMENPEVAELSDQGEEMRTLYAARAHWKQNAWYFYDVKLIDNTKASQEIVSVARTNFPSLREKPSQFIDASRQPEQLYTRELRRYIRLLARSGKERNLDSYRVELHGRYAFPWTCLMVVWIGFPLGMSVKKSGPMVSISTALLLVVGYYFSTHIVHALGGAGYIPPPLAAWLPTVAFFGIGSFLLWRSR
jgi:lipopolysaccharide export system permease protein